jgi:GGDEF domain-containing protein
MSPSDPKRRRYSRYPLFLDTLVRTGGDTLRGGKIRDFSDSGLYVAWDEPSSATLKIGQALEVRFRAGGGNARELQIAGSVARATRGGVGIIVGDMPAQVLDALRKEHALQSDRKKALSEEAARSKEPQIRAALEEIRRAIEKPLNAVIEAFSDEADHQLFQHASSAPSSEQRELLDARGALRTQRRRLQTEIVAAVLKEMMEEPESKPVAAMPELSMMGGSELEHMLARTELSTQVEDHHKKALSELQNRYSSLLGSHLDVGHLPGGPQSISAAFSDAIRSLGLSDRQLHLIHRIFQDVLCVRLGEMYQGMNQVLARVVPDVSAQPSKGARTKLDLDAKPAPPLSDSSPAVAEPDAGLPEPLQARLREAAAQPGFFSQKDHPLRRALAQVEELRTLIDPRDQSAHAQIDQMVQNLCQDEALPASSTVPAELDALVTKAREQSRRRQEDIVRQATRNPDSAAGGATVGGPMPLPPPMLSPRVQSVWRSAAQRLKVGDSLLVARDGRPPERQKLAWIGEDAESFVLVSPDGRKAATFNSSDLVARLAEGQIAVDRPAGPGGAEPAVYAMARAQHGEVRQQALLDPVTGLGNRKKFMSDWRAAPRVAEQRQTLLYLRVVDTEPLVERRGVAARDAFLKKLVSLIQERLGQRATMTRVGELEFAILHGGDELESRDAATRLQRDVRRIRIQSGGEVFVVGARIGVLEIPSGADLEAVLDSAGAAAQMPERSTDPVALPAAAQPVDWSAWLDTCLQGNSPELYLRRIESLREGGLPYAEISAGLEQGGQVRIPGEDADTGLLPEKLFDLDIAILGSVLDWLGQHADVLGHVEACLIRLRAASLADERLLDRILEMLMKSPVPPAKLYFEIPETALNASFDLTQGLVRTLRECGCGFMLGGFDRTEGQHENLNRLARMDFASVVSSCATWPAASATPRWSALPTRLVICWD